VAETSSYLTVQDVADRLGVSVFTIRRYIRAGKLRAVKLDGGYRLSRDDLADFLRSREIGGYAAAPSPAPRTAEAPGGHGADPSPSSVPTRPS
jgi:excisionase family DNA binding protein